VKLKALYLGLTLPTFGTGQADLEIVQFKGESNIL
jgi:hypothetical protein